MQFRPYQSTVRATTLKNRALYTLHDPDVCSEDAIRALECLRTGLGLGTVVLSPRSGPGGGTLVIDGASRIAAVLHALTSTDVCFDHKTNTFTFRQGVPVCTLLDRPSMNGYMVNNGLSDEEQHLLYSVRQSVVLDAEFVVTWVSPEDVPRAYQLIHGTNHPLDLDLFQEYTCST